MLVIPIEVRIEFSKDLLDSQWFIGTLPLSPYLIYKLSILLSYSTLTPKDIPYIDLLSVVAFDEVLGQVVTVQGHL